MTRTWLFKSEPDEFSFDDLLTRPDQTEPWGGVRNYQARNHLKEAGLGDRVLIYHSSIAEPCVAGVAEIVRTAYPDPSAFDEASPYHDPKSDPEAPRWFAVDVRAVARLPRPVTRTAMKAHPALAEMRLLRRGMRLSILPVEPDELEVVLALGGWELRDVQPVDL